MQEVGGDGFLIEHAVHDEVTGAEVTEATEWLVPCVAAGRAGAHQL